MWFQRYESYRAALMSFRETRPFDFHDLSGSVFRQAIRQLVSGALDRLHLAAMEELGQRRLLTNDAKQAAAAALYGAVKKIAKSRD